MSNNSRNQIFYYIYKLNSEYLKININVVVVCIWNNKFVAMFSFSSSLCLFNFIFVNKTKYIMNITMLLNFTFIKHENSFINAFSYVLDLI
jgi:hypothetical protein